MSSDGYGPGSDPVLHQGVETYCTTPVVASQFIPTAEDIRPPIRIYVLIYEIENNVYGQVLSQLRSDERIEPPHIHDWSLFTLPELEYESRNSHDPILVLHETLEGLYQTCESLGGSSIDPILDQVSVTDRKYTEVGVELVRKFEIPFVKFKGYISKEDVDLSVEHTGYCPHQAETDVVADMNSSGFMGLPK